MQLADRVRRGPGRGPDAQPEVLNHRERVQRVRFDERIGERLGLGDVNIPRFHKSGSLLKFTTARPRRVRSEWRQGEGERLASSPLS